MQKPTNPTDPWTFFRSGGIPRHATTCMYSTVQYSTYRHDKSRICRDMRICRLIGSWLRFVGGGEVGGGGGWGGEGRVRRGGEGEEGEGRVRRGGEVGGGEGRRGGEVR